MADIVANVLQAAAEKEAKFKPVEVKKDIELDFDIGNLLAIDHNPLELKAFRANKDQFLSSLARDNTQLLLNKIWELKTEHVDEAVVAHLPLPTTQLPREKPIPKGRIETKWSAYAKLKGIQKKKKSRMVWDDEQQKWLPRWGYKRINDPKNDWVLEVPQNADPFEDQFEKRQNERKERIAKNELQRLRNIGRNTKGKIKAPTPGVLPNETRDKKQLSLALTEARRSTASVGRFTDSLPKEKPEKGGGKKRKFEPNIGDHQGEKQRALDVLGKITNKQPIMDVDKAANRAMAAEERIRASSKTGKKGKGGKGGPAKGNQGRKGKNGGKVPKGGRTPKGGKRGKR